MIFPYTAEALQQQSNTQQTHPFTTFPCLLIPDIHTQRKLNEHKSVLVPGTCTPRTPVIAASPPGRLPPSIAYCLAFLFLAPTLSLALSLSLPV